MFKRKSKTIALILILLTLSLAIVAVYLAISLQNREQVTPTDSEAASKSSGCDAEFSSGPYAYGHKKNGRITIVNCSHNTLSGSCKVLHHHCDDKDGDDGKSGQCSSDPRESSQSYSMPSGYEETLSVDCDPGDCGSCQADIECEVGGKTYTDGIFKSSGKDCRECKDSKKCEGNDMVKRDCDGNEKSREKNHQDCIQECNETEQCEGSNWVKRDCNKNVVSVVENDPRCVCNESAACEGTDWVVRDCKGNEKSRAVKDPRCYDPPVCDSMTVDGGKSKKLKPGQSASVNISVSKPTVNNGVLAYYNQDNLYGPNNPKPAGLSPANSPLQVVSEDNGLKKTLHPFTGNVSNQKLTASFTVTYDQLFNNTKDLNTGSEIKKIQANAYAGGAPRSDACVIYFEKLPPDPTDTPVTITDTPVTITDTPVTITDTPITPTATEKPTGQLIIEKKANPTIVDPEAIVDYEIQVTNNSTIAQDVYKIVDDFNDAMTYVPGTAEYDGSGSPEAEPVVEGKTLVWDFSASPIPLDSGEFFTITYKMKAPKVEGTYPNVAILYDKDDKKIDEDEAVIEIDDESPDTGIPAEWIMILSGTAFFILLPATLRRVRMNLLVKATETEGADSRKGFDLPSKVDLITKKLRGKR